MNFGEEPVAPLEIGSDRGLVMSPDGGLGQDLVMKIEPFFIN
jgi:hypothetical protein